MQYCLKICYFCHCITFYVACGIKFTLFKISHLHHYVFHSGPFWFILCCNKKMNIIEIDPEPEVEPEPEPEPEPTQRAMATQTNTEEMDNRAKDPFHIPFPIKLHLVSTV